MKKYASLNPEEKLNRYISPVSAWFRCIAFIILLIKVDFPIAVLFIGMILTGEYFGYKYLKNRAIEFKKGDGIGNPEKRTDRYTVFSWLWTFGIVALALLIFGVY